MFVKGYLGRQQKVNSMTTPLVNYTVLLKAHFKATGRFASLPAHTTTMQSTSLDYETNQNFRLQKNVYCHVYCHRYHDPRKVNPSHTIHIFCRRYFEMHFLQWKFSYVDSKFQAEPAPSHYLNQSWPNSPTHTWGTREWWLILSDPRVRFLSLARSKLRLCSANHRPGYWSNLPYDGPAQPELTVSKWQNTGPGEPCFGATTAIA